MAQHDYILDNGAGASLRSDLNNVLAAISSTNSGATEPTTKYAGMLWLDTKTPVTLKVMNSTLSDWMPVAVGSGFLPLAGGTVNGDLAVAGIFHDDDWDKVRVNYASKTAPTAPVGGQLWYDTNTVAGKLKIRSADNTTWLDVVDLTAPTFYDAVYVNSATGSAQLNLISAGERRRIIGNQGASRFDFYGLNDAFMGCISDSGDLYVQAIPGWVSNLLAAKQPALGYTPVAQYDGNTIQIGGNPAHLWINGVDQGEINTSNNSGFLTYDTIGTYCWARTVSGSVAYNGLIAGSSLYVYPGSSVTLTGTYRAMEAISSASAGLVHKVA